MNFGTCVEHAFIPIFCGTSYVQAVEHGNFNLYTVLVISDIYIALYLH